MAIHTTTQNIQDATRGTAFKDYWLTDDEPKVLASACHVVTHAICGPYDVTTYHLLLDPIYYH